ncbi:MAG: hypothetical protein RI637_07685 [Acidimicrobiia bacterium]|nr:hypothetical protein [Acidimicrobiia bacterium]
MVVFRTLALLGAVTMTLAVVLGFLSGGFVDEGSAIWALAWGKVTLIDLYVGLVFFGVWVWVRERRLMMVVLWWAGLVVLGNLAAALYLVFASFSSSTVHELLTGERPNSQSAVLPKGEVAS